MPRKRTVRILLVTEDLTCFFIHVFLWFRPYSKHKNKDTFALLLPDLVWLGPNQAVEWEGTSTEAGYKI